MNFSVSVSQTQHLQSEMLISGTHRHPAGFLIPQPCSHGLVHKYQGKETAWYIYTRASFISGSTLWPDTCDFFVKMCLSYRMIVLTLKYIQDFLMCSAGRIPFTCYQQMILYYKLNSVLLHWAMMMLIFDVMQPRIRDSIAPGATLSVAEFTKHVICGVFLPAMHSQWFHK